jgi:hypothetical protein
MPKLKTQHCKGKYHPVHCDVTCFQKQKVAHLGVELLVLVALQHATSAVSACVRPDLQNEKNALIVHGQ